MFKTMVEMPLEEKALMSRTKYGEEVKTSIMEGTESPQMIIHFLKMQLIE